MILFEGDNTGSEQNVHYKKSPMYADKDDEEILKGGNIFDQGFLNDLSSFSEIHKSKGTSKDNSKSGSENFKKKAKDFSK